MKSTLVVEFRLPTARDNTDQNRLDQVINHAPRLLQTLRWHISSTSDHFRVIHGELSLVVSRRPLAERIVSIGSLSGTFCKWCVNLSRLSRTVYELIASHTRHVISVRKWRHRPEVPLPWLAAGIPLLPSFCLSPFSRYRRKIYFSGTKAPSNGEINISVCKDRRQLPIFRHSSTVSNDLRVIRDFITAGYMRHVTWRHRP